MKIFGTIKDENDKPLENVHVRMKLFNSVGAYTDSSGAFVKDSPAIKETDDILISYVGYESKTLKASDLVGKKINLTPSTTELNEVVVTPNDLVGTTNTSSISSNYYVSGVKKTLFQRYKTPLTIVGVLGLMTASVLIIKKVV